MTVARTPLTPVSPNSRRIVTSEVRVVEDLVDRSYLPSLASFSGVRGVYQSPFEKHCDYDFEAAESDSWWMRYLGRNALRDMSVDEYLQEVGCQPNSAKQLSSDFEFDGMEDYDNHRAGGVSWSCVVGMMRGTYVDYHAFFVAEGLFSRLVLTIPDHNTRLMALKLWVVIVGRMVGLAAVEKPSRVLDVLEDLDVFDHCPTAKITGMFGAFIMPAQQNLRAQQLWFYTVKCMADVRKQFWYYWAYDVDYCITHAVDCPACYGDDDEGSTRENTPEVNTGLICN